VSGAAPGGRRGRRLGRRLVAIGWALAGAGCVIPDPGIQAEDEFVNMGGVRIIEPTPITARADEDCDDLPGVVGCPRVPDNSLPSGLIRPESPLCLCPDGDLGLGGFDLLVEDPDVDDDNEPSDTIIGAFFLDMPPEPDDPRDYLAYKNQLPPEEPARRFRADELFTIERPNPNLKAWAIAPQSRWDLCNDNDGAQIDRGLHQLRLIVTDRPWYRPALVDDEGQPQLDDEGQPQLGDPVTGMPDLPAGATYDSTTYVFECFQEGMEPEGIVCSCEV